MTPARRQTLEAAVAIIREANGRDQLGDDPLQFRAKLIALGAQFIDGKRNTMKLAGITATLDFDNGEHLMLRWARNASTALENAAPGEGSEEEE